MERRFTLSSVLYPEPHDALDTFFPPPTDVLWGNHKAGEGVGPVAKAQSLALEREKARRGMCPFPIENLSSSKRKVSTCRIEKVFWENDQRL